MSAPINIYGKGHTFIVCFQSEDQVTELFMKIDSSSDGEINWVFSNVHNVNTTNCHTNFSCCENFKFKKYS